jgi:hypothetical protein
VSSFAAERERLQASIDRERRELEVALVELQRAAERKLDPRERIARSPYRWLAAAFLIGVWLGRPRHA